MTLPPSILPRRRVLHALGAAGLVCTPGLRAQPAWPTKPLRIIVPSGAGSGADLLCRLFSERLALALKQPVVVDNKPGANGLLAADQLVRAAPDGYTLAWLSSSSTVVNKAVQPQMAFDVIRDTEAIVQVGVGGIALVVTPDFPARSLAEFVAAVKARPAGELNYASWGIGSTGHLVMEWLKTRAGLDLRHVPYKTMPQIYQDMQGGNIQIAWVDVSSSVPLIKSGLLRCVAVSGTQRSPQMPDVPTLTQQGHRFDTDAWYGVFAPKDTPPAVVATINRHVRAALLAPELKERRITLNLDDNTPQRSPEEFARTVRADLRLWQEIARQRHQAGLLIPASASAFGQPTYAPSTWARPLKTLGIIFIGSLARMSIYSVQVINP